MCVVTSWQSDTSTCSSHLRAPAPSPTTQLIKADTKYDDTHPVPSYGKRTNSVF